MTADNSQALLRPARQLTYAGAALALEAATERAREIGVPQCVSVVDSGGNLLAFARMDGARVLAQHSSFAKAQSAASIAAPTGHVPAQFGVDLALATGGRSVNLVGGPPILVDGDLIGAIGVGSGAPDQDLSVAEAGRDALLRAVEAEQAPEHAVDRS